VLCDAGLCWHEQPADRVGVTSGTGDALAAAKRTIDSLLAESQTA
jgi:hypothetical protein